jgi:hypothetical protein
MSTKHDLLPTHSHDEFPSVPLTHTAPTKRSAKIIAGVLLGVLVLLTIYAGFTYISYLMSPRGEYSFPL